MNIFVQFLPTQTLVDFKDFNFQTRNLLRHSWANLRERLFPGTHEDVTTPQANGQIQYPMSEIQTVQRRHSETYVTHVGTPKD